MNRTFGMPSLYVKKILEEKRYNELYFVVNADDCDLFELRKGKECLLTTKTVLKNRLRNAGDQNIAELLGIEFQVSGDTGVISWSHFLSSFFPCEYIWQDRLDHYKLKSKIYTLYLRNYRFDGSGARSTFYYNRMPDKPKTFIQKVRKYVGL